MDGESAISAKRVIRRYDYAQHPIAHVSIETAGTVDLDIELKFTIGDKLFSIDVRKSHLEALKDMYKALHTIGKLQKRDEVGRMHAMTAASVLGAGACSRSTLWRLHVQEVRRRGAGPQ